MLTAKGQVKIMDFGLAAVSGRSRLTKPGTTLGAPAYMSPEQLEGGDVDRRADIWALGAVLYEMLTQRTPFAADYEQAIAYGILNEEPEPVTALRSGLPTEIDRVIAKALAKGPDERYQHVDELAVDLRQVRGEGGSSRALSSKTQVERRAPSWRQLAVAAALLVTTSVGLTPVTAPRKRSRSGNSALRGGSHCKLSSR